MSEFTTFVQQCFEDENLPPAMRLFVVGFGRLVTEMSVDDKVKGCSFIDEIVNDLEKSDLREGTRKVMEMLANLMRQDLQRGVMLGNADNWTAAQKAEIRAMIRKAITILERLTA